MVGVGLGVATGVGVEVTTGVGFGVALGVVRDQRVLARPARSRV
jgi:hypothetical protein